MNARTEIKDSRTERILLSTLLKDGVSVCLVFPHGMGDVVMFRPVFHHLRRLYPKCRIDLMPRPEYRALGTCDDDFVYDFGFWVKYLCTNGANGVTKNRLCCINELGITPPLDEQPDAVAGFRSPLVGIGVTSISNAGLVPTAYETRELVRGIEQAGFIPVDTAMAIPGVTFPKNQQVKLSLSSCPGTYEKICGFIERCHAFIGTISGAYHLAQAIMPSRTLMLCPRAGEWRKLYTREPANILCRDVTARKIKDWLDGLH